MATVLDCDYKTTIGNGSVYGLNKCFGVPNVDIDTGKQICYVNWLFHPEVRSWGIKSISVYATQIFASVEWEVYIEDLNEEEKAKLIAANGTVYANKTINGLIQVDSCKEWNGKKWTIDSEFKMEEDGMCSPQDVDIDFENMIISIT